MSAVTLQHLFDCKPSRTFRISFSNNPFLLLEILCSLHPSVPQTGRCSQPSEINQKKLSKQTAKGIFPAVIEVWEASGPPTRETTIGGGRGLNGGRSAERLSDPRPPVCIKKSGLAKPHKRFVFTISISRATSTIERVRC